MSSGQNGLFSRRVVLGIGGALAGCAAHSVARRARPNSDQSALVDATILSRVYAEFRAQDCVVEVAVNGIPIRRVSHGENTLQSIQVGNYLVHGDNVLEVLINPGPTPVDARAPFTGPVSADASVAARLVLYDAKDLLDGNSGLTLGHLAWRSADQENDKFPHATKLVAKLPVKPPRWKWLDAEPIHLERDWQEIVAVLERVHGAFAALDPLPVIELTGVYYAELAQAFPGMTEREWYAELAADMEYFGALGEWRMYPLQEGEFSLRTCADARLVECVGTDWRPVIRSETLVDGEPYFFPMFLGKHDNSWQILR